MIVLRSTSTFVVIKSTNQSFIPPLLFGKMTEQGEWMSSMPYPSVPNLFLSSPGQPHQDLVTSTPVEPPTSTPDDAPNQDPAEPPSSQSSKRLGDAENPVVVDVGVLPCFSLSMSGSYHARVLR
jgi:hypothetical protein